MNHHIQRSILDQLARCTTARYSQLKPTQLSGNVFNYHLSQLVRDGLVQKMDSGAYQLSPLGLDAIRVYSW